MFITTSSHTDYSTNVSLSRGDIVEVLDSTQKTGEWLVRKVDDKEQVRESFVYGYNCLYTTVYIQLSMGITVYIQLSMGTTVYGYNCLWVQLSMGTTVYGYNCLWVQLSMGTTVYGTTVYGYNCLWV